MSTSTHRHRATVTRASEGYAIATDSDGIQFMLFYKNFDQLSGAAVSASTLQLGSIVTFVPIDGPKGPRALEIRIERI